MLQLQNGTDQLSGGLVQFNDEGISQLTGALDADQLHALQTVVEEMTGRLADYTSFAGVPEGVPVGNEYVEFRKKKSSTRPPRRPPKRLRWRRRQTTPRRAISSSACGTACWPCSGFEPVRSCLPPPARSQECSRPGALFVQHTQNSG